MARRYVSTTMLNNKADIEVRIAIEQLAAQIRDEGWLDHALWQPPRVGLPWTDEDTGLTWPGLMYLMAIEADHE